MKKLFLSVALTGLLTSTLAFADDVSLGVNVGGGAPPSASLFIGQPQVVVAPQPVYVTPPQTVIVERPQSYDEHHREHDRRYWERRREEERRERERREHERHEHDDHRYDHDHDHHYHDDQR